MAATPQVMANLAYYGQSKPPVGLPPAPISTIDVDFEEVSSCKAKLDKNVMKAFTKLSDSTMEKGYVAISAVGNVPKADSALVLGCAFLFGKVYTDDTNLFIEAPFDLGSIDLDQALSSGTSSFKTQVTNSGIQLNVNEIRKAVPHKGDIVAVVCSSGSAFENTLTSYYASYVKHSGVIINATGPVTYNFWIGISNTTQTDFVTPFDITLAGYIDRAIISPNDARNYL